MLAGCTSVPPTPPPPNPAVAAAESIFETGPGPYTFNCNVPSGFYNERNVHTPREGFVVKGLLRFIGIQSDARWIPFSAVEVAGPNRMSNVGVILDVDPYQPGKILLGIRSGFHNHGKPTAFATLPYSNVAIPFELSVIEPGKLTASFGEYKSMATFPETDLTRVRMTCGTAHVQFSNVVVTVLSK